MNAYAPSLPTLSDAVFPEAGRLVRASEVAAMSLVIALGAQLQVPLPFSPVPMTGQTFGVLMAGMLLGARGGALAVAAYLTEGLLGLPFFAGGAAGPLVFAGPSGGYLIGFLPAAWFAGLLAEQGWDRTPVRAAAAMLAGSAAIFACGVLGLARFLPASELLRAGVLPFLPGDVVKAGLAAAALPWAWRLVSRRPLP
ncbi:MAG: biotin transporter BioY [Elusimicrobia bacterium]|nr:biotin transporter BioY [Elusimicrobiota bacterium]